VNAIVASGVGASHLSFEPFGVEAHQTSKVFRRLLKELFEEVVFLI